MNCVPQTHQREKKPQNPSLNLEQQWALENNSISFTQKERAEHGHPPWLFIGVYSARSLSTVSCTFIHSLLRLNSIQETRKVRHWVTELCYSLNLKCLSTGSYFQNLFFDWQHWWCKIFWLLEVVTRERYLNIISSSVSVLFSAFWSPPCEQWPPLLMPYLLLCCDELKSPWNCEPKSVFLHEVASVKHLVIAT